MQQITLKTLWSSALLVLAVMVSGGVWGQIISQYVETNSGTTPKGIEIWNNTGYALDFSANNLIIQQGANGGSLSDLPGTRINSGTLASGEVLVIGTPDIGTYLTNQGLTSVTYVSYGFSFNGDDALAVKYGVTITDVFGTPGVDPGDAWSGSGISTANQNIQLLSSISAGDSDGWSDPSTRFETVSSDPVNDLSGFGLSPAAISTFSGVGNWSEGTNWNNGVPTANMNAVINGNATVDVASIINNVTIMDGASLIDNNNLTINGTFTMQRTIANDNGWHLIAAPTTGMAITGSDFVPAGSPLATNFDFYSFDETASPDVWVNIRQGDNTPNPAFSNFVNGKGYLVAYSGTYGNANFDYTGTMNTGTIPSPVLTYSAAGQQGWNLIGNPYPSAIDWSAATKTQFADNFTYIYNEGKSGGAGYESINGMIAPNQGFFVELKEANHGQTFSFTDAIRDHGGTFLKTENNFDEIQLRLGNENYFDETIIRLENGSEYDRDRNDARKLLSFNPSVPQLFSNSADEIQLAINAIPEVTEDVSIPLGVFIPIEGQYYLRLMPETSTLAESVILEDLKMGIQINLTETEAYDFIASPDDNPNRFVLHFGALSINDNSGQLAATAYVHGGQLYILNGKGMTDIKVLDVQGRLLQSLQQHVEGVYSTGFNLPAGMYIIQLQDAQGVRNNKVIKQ